MTIISVMFVCTGNICRSPSAHGVFRDLVEKESLSKHFIIESSGTQSYHAGEPPDSRSSQVALQRGYDLSDLRAQQLKSSDFETFDYLLAMDEGHYRNMMASCPSKHHEKVMMFLQFAPEFKEIDVPDPYYGGEHGFDHVLDLVESACKGILQHVKQHHSL